MTELRSKYHVVRKAQLLEKAVQRSDHYNKKLAAKFSHPTDLVIFLLSLGPLKTSRRLKLKSRNFQAKQTLKILAKGEQ